MTSLICMSLNLSIQNVKLIFFLIKFKGALRKNIADVNTVISKPE